MGQLTSELPGPAGRRAPAAWLALALGWGLASCQCVELPDALFACEPDGTCAQPGYHCGADLLCRPSMWSDAGLDAGLGDAGSDAGLGDAGSDAGLGDAGSDAGLGDAGSDAGLGDAGTDAGLGDAGSDAGLGDAGTDAGLGDAGSDAGLGDAGSDAGLGDAGSDAGCLGYDLPDDMAVDSNCDGIDGELANAALVAPSGSDLGDGTMASPYLTIGRALVSGKPHILVATGTYSEDLTFGSGRIWGGYDAQSGWARSATPAVIHGHVVVDGDGGFVTLDTLRVEAPDASSPGGSSIAVILRHVDQGAALNRLTLIAGDGASGAGGNDAASADAGRPGAPGTSGPDGGLGGPGGPAQSCPDGTSEPGWTGGHGASTFPGDGTTGGGDLLGGAGGVGVECTTPPCEAAAGGAGLVAPVSTNGDVGAAGSITGDTSGITWVPTRGGLGGAGAHGRGGGGGGGGGGFLGLLAEFFGFGGGGGGGGSGGCGGLGGSGGEGGGASIALLLLDASPTLTQVTLQAGHGGPGGPGGLGGAGGPGGPGAAGGEGEPVEDAGLAGAGGLGAPGQAGGAGGRGGGGAGGPGVGLWCGAGSAPTRASVSISAGVGGTGGAPNGPLGLSATTYGCP